MHNQKCMCCLQLYKKNTIEITRREEEIIQLQIHASVKPLVAFNDMNVEYITEIKFLGIQITDTLKWHSRIQFLAGKLCKVAIMVKPLKEILSPNLIRNIYFSKFHSLLRFGILFWGGGQGVN